MRAYNAPMKKPHTPNTLRIIGGQWRGRKLPFANLEGLRPTPDRVRETLFNWLQGPIQCARCLDLYAGSGALGLEALSRGANHVLMADTQQQVIRQLQQNCQTLSCNLATFHSGSALQLLEMGTSQPYNIAFIDPPYRKGLVEPTCRLLEQKQWLSDGALIYLEVEQELKELPVPENWELLKSKKAGQVSYHLLKRHASTKESS
jgi:16S rRNA (guanine966-N2)-methyltransferase